MQRGQIPVRYQDESARFRCDYCGALPGKRCRSLKTRRAVAPHRNRQAKIEAVWAAMAADHDRAEAGRRGSEPHQCNAGTP